jgi:hypothetical protein
MTTAYNHRNTKLSKQMRRPPTPSGVRSIRARAIVRNFRQKSSTATQGDVAGQTLNLPPASVLQQPGAVMALITSVTETRKILLRTDAESRERELALCAHAALFLHEHPNVWNNFCNETGRKPRSSPSLKYVLRAVCFEYVSGDRKKRQKDASYFSRALHGPLVETKSAIKTYQLLQDNGVEDLLQMYRNPKRNPRTKSVVKLKCVTVSEDGEYFVKLPENARQTVTIVAPKGGGIVDLIVKTRASPNCSVMCLKKKSSVGAKHLAK